MVYKSGKEHPYRISLDDDIGADLTYTNYLSVGRFAYCGI